MNKKQRQKLEKIKEQLQEVQIEEQEKFDNAPENLMESEMYEKIQENADTLEEIIDNLEELLES